MHVRNVQQFSLTITIIVLTVEVVAHCHRKVMMNENRMTRFAVRCRGTIIGYVDSYYSIELEHDQLLGTASKAAGEGGFCCLDVWKQKDGVPCEQLSATVVEPFWKKSDGSE